jgi:hypothetical protein
VTRGRDGGPQPFGDAVSGVAVASSVGNGAAGGVVKGDKGVVRPQEVVGEMVVRDEVGAAEERQSPTTSTTAILAADWSTMDFLAEKVVS